MHSIAFLPGMLLDEQSFSRIDALLGTAGHETQTYILGHCATLEAEIKRLADLALSPQVWIGHSLGGILALNLAAAYPEKCAALVCIASTARADAPSNGVKRLAQLHRAQVAGSCEPIALEMQQVFGLVAGHSSSLASSLMTQAASVGLRRYAHQTEYALTRPDQRMPGHTMTCPVLAIAGLDDNICPPELSDEIAALGIHTHISRCVRIPGAGHLVPMTHAQAIAGHITDFLVTLKD